MVSRPAAPEDPLVLELTRPVWIGLAEHDSVVERAASEVGETPFAVTADGDRFRRLLIDARPRIAVLSVPPACPADLERALDQRHRRSTLRLIHVSSDDDIEARLEALELGFDDAVPRSIDPVELIARLRLQDARTRRKPDTVLAVADGIELDLVAHEVRRDGALIHLRPKEFQLLAMLAAHPGRAYTRRQLLDRVWGHDHDGDPRTVDVHVRWLRSKLEPRPEAPIHLVTVRGVGYRLDPAPR